MPLYPTASSSDQQPARALNTDFVVSKTRPSLVFYSVRLTTSISLAGASSATAELRVNNAVKSSASNTLSGTLVVGLALTNASEFSLCAYVPAGQTVRLATTGTASLIRVNEVIL